MTRRAVRVADATLVLLKSELLAQAYAWFQGVFILKQAVTSAGSYGFEFTASMHTIFLQESLLPCLGHEGANGDAFGRKISAPGAAVAVAGSTHCRG